MILILKNFDLSKQRNVLVTIINADFIEQESNHQREYFVFPLLESMKRLWEKQYLCELTRLLQKLFQSIKWIFGQLTRMNNTMVKMQKLYRCQSGGKWKLHLATHRSNCSRQRK